MVKIKAGAILKKYWWIVKNAASGFGNDNAVKLSGSLAYSTIFSLPPMLLLIIVFAGSFYGQDALSGRIFLELKNLIGADSALQVQNVIKGLEKQKGSWLAMVIGTIALVIGATGIFTEIQSSLNSIWGVRVKAKKGLVKLLLNRLISISMILGLGFLLIVSLVINTVITGLSREILHSLPTLPINMINVISTITLFFVLSLLFAFIFKMLPDVHIRWKYVWPGAFVTTVLFLLGKMLIGLYVSTNATISLYGAASSIIVLLVWIYFSAFILYFGAEFTKAYIEYEVKTIIPNSYSEFDAKRLWKQYLKTKEMKEEAEKAKPEQPDKSF
jgi:membrane protein